MRLFVLLFLGLLVSGCGSMKMGQEMSGSEYFVVKPIGKVVREEGRTFIVVQPQYLEAMMGVEDLREIVVVYWFDRNDTAEKRSIMQVHPQGNEKKPLRGVFATHSPVRPNLIAISRCRVLSVKENVIEIEEIDAFDETPVIDIKSG